MHTCLFSTLPPRRRMGVFVQFQMAFWQPPYPTVLLLDDHNTVGRGVTRVFVPGVNQDDTGTFVGGVVAVLVWAA